MTSCLQNLKMGSNILFRMTPNIGCLVNYNTAFSSSLCFVPKHSPVCDNDITQVKEFLSCHKKIMVLTGAGISTESGIPDYRSEGVGLYARSSSRPLQFMEFLRSPAARGRYWARNYSGWERFSSIKPNSTHFALQKLEQKLKKVTSIVTQNVDELHTKAGSKNVVELHGSAYRVVCLHCNYSTGRHLFQDVLRKLNPSAIASRALRPDGDVDIPQDQVETFIVPACPDCGGILKPDIVFFGDNVPRNRVDLVKQKLEDSDALLVLGSSLSVFSGYRFILRASELKKPIAIINIGETRGDRHATIKIDKKCGEVVAKVCEMCL